MRSSGDANRDKPGQRSPRNRPTRNPGRQAKKRAGREKAWEQPARGRQAKKAGMGGDLLFGCKTRMKGSFYALLCNGETRGTRKRREFTRGAVEDIERRELLFV